MVMFIRILTMLLTIGLIAPGLRAQYMEPLENHAYCSSINNFRASFKAPTDNDQSPLLFDYDVKFYHFDLNISSDTTFLSGSVEYLAEAVANELDTFVVELIDEMEIDSIVFDGTAHEYYRYNNEVFIPIELPVAQSALFSCRIFYHGTPPPGEFFNGVTIAYNTQWDQSVVWTLAEPFNARQWWPTKQVLDDKADSVWVFLTTDATNRAGSIGLLEQEVILPDNRVRYEWKSRYPIAYYLISYAVANYQEYTFYGKPASLLEDSIPIVNYIYNSPGCLDHYKEGIDRTGPLMELFSDLYTLYPFYEEKYGHCLTELSGGMEHQTMTTIGHFGFGLVAHELAHMWFGDNVTCATWSDIWVNEGFATYSDYLAHEYIAGDPWASIWLKNAHNYVVSQPDGSVYVPPEEVYYGNESRIFSSRLTYFKGAYLLHMLRYALDDDELFFMVMQDFQGVYADSVATAMNFMEVLNETTGKDFTEFFDQWFFGQGYPIYNIDWIQVDDVFEITSYQSASDGDVTPFFHMNYPVKLFLDDGTDTTIQIEQTQPLAIEIVNISKGVDSIQVDPDYWVLKQVASINSIVEIGNGDIRIYPNPAFDKLQVQSFNTMVSKGTVFNAEGKEMFIFYNENSEFTLDIQTLKPGMYFISMESDDNTKILKFIKH